MIFNKDSIFPYPILSNSTDDYPNSRFDLEVDFFEIEDKYRFQIKYEITSNYIKRIIERNLVNIILVIKSTDSKYFVLDKEYVDIEKNRIGVQGSKTEIQLYIKTTTQLHYVNNDDLHPSYNEDKNLIFIEKDRVIGYSNIVKFDGEMKKPFNLFKFKFDEDLKSDISIDFETELIIIKYKNDRFKYVKFNRKRLNYHYVYLGLSRALMKFLKDELNEEENYYINEMDEPNNLLNRKLYRLMKINKVSELSFENIDEVIHKISDSIILKHTLEVERLSSYED